jgi:hypothetical protein
VSARRAPRSRRLAFAMLRRVTSAAEISGPLERGNAALDRGDWRSAADAFRGALLEVENRDVHDSLGHS